MKPDGLFFRRFLRRDNNCDPYASESLGATGQDVSSSKIRLVSPVQAAKAAEAEDA